MGSVDGKDELRQKSDEEVFPIEPLQLILYSAFLILWARHLVVVEDPTNHPLVKQVLVGAKHISQNDPRGFQLHALTQISTKSQYWSATFLGPNINQARISPTLCCSKCRHTSFLYIILCSEKYNFYGMDRQHIQ